LSRKIVLLTVLALLACAAAVGASAGSQAPAKLSGSTNLDSGWTVPGQLLVRFRDNASAGAMATANSTVGAQVLQSFQIVHNLKLVSVPDAVSALAAYKADPSVLYAQPNYIYRINKTPNDPRYGELWNLNNTGQGGGKPDADVDAPEAWNKVTGSMKIAVGDIDTGITYTHEDLAAHTMVNPAECNGKSGVDDDGNGYVDDCHGIDTFNHDSDPIDDAGHGTHTAGTIGAVGNNGKGVVGVNWDVTIVSCKSHAADGNGTAASIIECYQYMEIEKAHGVNVVATNNSYGGCNEACGYDQATYDAIKSNMRHGIVFVASAGNDSSNNDTTAKYPATYYLPNIISVAATDKNDNKASFSNYGIRTVTLGAPGVSVLSTYLNNGYAFLSGTSMAGPYVAGTVGLLAAEHPTWSWKQLRNVILAGAEPIASMNGKTVTGGRLNLDNSVRCSNKPFFGVLRPLQTQSGKTITISAYNIVCSKPSTDVLKVTIKPGGTTLTLVDNGKGPDLAKGDGIFSVRWKPATCKPGTYTFDFSNGQSVTSSLSC